MKTKRFVLIGDAKVGKSSVLHRFTESDFFAVYEPTIGVDFQVKRIQTDNQETVKLQLWDTGGHPQYESLVPTYLRQAHAVFLIYAIDDRKSFENVKKQWTQMAKQYGSPERRPVFVLVGNKCDLKSPRREKANKQVLHEEAQDFAKDNSMLFTEVSAKTGFGIHAMMEGVTASLPRRTSSLRRHIVSFQRFQAQEESDESLNCADICNFVTMLFCLCWCS